jgi:hypothetical protein
MVEFDDLAEEDLHRIFEGNVYAQLALIRACLPQMRERNSGTIVNMISATAYQDPPARIGNGGWGMGYAMSKAALARVAPAVAPRARGLRHPVVQRRSRLRRHRKDRSPRASRTVRAALQAGHPPVIGAAIRWLVEDREADSLRGQIVMAQRETKRRGCFPAGRNRCVNPRASPKHSANGIVDPRMFKPTEVARKPRTGLRSSRTQWCRPRVTRSPASARTSAGPGHGHERRERPHRGAIYESPDRALDRGERTSLRVLAR